MSTHFFIELAIQLEQHAFQNSGPLSLLRETSYVCRPIQIASGRRKSIAKSPFLIYPYSREKGVALYSFPLRLFGTD